ncbi:penicillin-binding protein [Neisseria gonorrhoeae DGI2]|uniref:serine-type D-Ala-D-Ala carboxypeptidase n=4 Tax=Neisseria gonorrhoeae TaxID=485 RepID=A0AA44U838_NEIGO|nr:Penicillin-binding protein [Neisseria gonorrhoeae NCCP11945]APW52870.1 cytochrome C550 [Neisseria gonorrhoeae NG-k51.05]EFE03101.1 penicillin-binding protein [Neisseria gonorrhoeae DGI2]PHJ35003.1 cytochrome C550 [Neisseria gonorrhoeae 3502]SCW10724.1 putative D-alanyl-D-alanine carboxypeptidase / penicillin binding protein [Neisseria gonorrhoeae]
MFIIQCGIIGLLKSQNPKPYAQDGAKARKIRPIRHPKRIIGRLKHSHNLEYFMTAHKILPVLLPIILGVSHATAASPAPNRPTVHAAPTLQTPETLTAAHIVIDLQSRQTLSAKNTNTPVEPAALTQLMTAYLVFKNMKSGNIQSEENLKIPESAWASEGSRMFVRPGDTVSTDKLLKGMIALCANDAALTLADRLGNGSIENFVQQMNKEARRLGMKNTVFKNPTGLGREGQVSTAKDLALLSEALMRDFPEYYPLFSIKSFKFENIEQNNRNILLYRDNNVNGLKAGHTESGGYNLAVSYSGNGRHILVITLGSESAETRASDNSKLLNRALQAFDTPKIYPKGKTVAQIQISGGSKKTVRAGFLKEAYITLPHKEAKMAEQILETIQPIPAPVKKGQILGKIKIRQNGHTIAEKEIVALENVEKRSRWQRLWTRLTGQ